MVQSTKTEVITTDKYHKASFREEKSDITCIHTEENKYIYIGTKTGKLGMYRLEEDNTCTVISEGTKKTGAKIISIQSDPIYQILFVLYDDKELNLCAYDLRNLREIGTKLLANAHKVNCFAVDQSYKNHRLAYSDDKSVYFYLYKLPSSKKKTKDNMLEEQKKEQNLIRSQKFDHSIIKGLNCYHSNQVKASWIHFIGDHLLVEEYNSHNFYQLIRVRKRFDEPNEKDQLYHSSAILWKYNKKNKFQSHERHPKVINLGPLKEYIKPELHHFYKKSFLLLLTDLDCRYNMSWLTNYGAKMPYPEMKKANNKKGETSKDNKDEDLDNPFQVTFNEALHFSYRPVDVAFCYPFFAAVLHDTTSNTDFIEIVNLYGPQNSNMGFAKTTTYTFECSIISIEADNYRFYVVGKKNTKSILYILTPPFNTLEDLMKVQCVESISHYHKMKLKLRKSHVKSDEAAINAASCGLKFLKEGEFPKAFSSFKEARKTNNEKTKLKIQDILHCYHQVWNPSAKNRFKILDDGIPLICDKRELPDISQGESKLPHHITLEDEYKHNFKEHSILQCIIHQAIEELFHFLLDTKSDQFEDITNERFDIDYALFVLYLRKIEISPDAYSDLEDLLKQSPYLQSEAEIVLKLLKQSRCFRASFILKNELKVDKFKLLRDIRVQAENDKFFQKNNCSDILISIMNEIDINNILKRDECRDALKWLIIHDPSKMLDVFIGRPESEYTTIIEILKSYPNIFLVYYLQYLFGDRGESSKKNTAMQLAPLLHTQYAIALIKDIVTLNPSCSTSENQSNASDNDSTMKEVSKLMSTQSIKVKSGEEKGLLGEFRRILLNHLRQSKSYDTKTVEKELENTSLYDEMVELCRTMGDHKKALTIKLKNLEDYEGAEEYCIQVFEEEKKLKKKERMEKFGLKTDTNVNVEDICPFNNHFITLLKVYLECWKNSDNEYHRDKYYNKLLDMLNYRAVMMDPHDVLNCFFNSSTNFDCEIMKIYKFLRKSVQNVHHKCKTGQVKHNLHQQANEKTKERFERACGRRLVVKEHTMCVKCEGKIGTSVFAVFPDGTAVHYKCLDNLEQQSEERKIVRVNEKDLNIHPHTRVNFSKFPVDF